MKHEESKYRLGVGIMLLNQENKVFVGQRAETSSEAWQMPQGGIDEDEAPEAAVMRELEEEIGTSHVEIIKTSPIWYTYDIPAEMVAQWWNGKFIGQKQKWFLMRFLGTDQEINIHTQNPEFIAWKWVDIDTLPEIIVHFKKQLYIDLITEFKPLITS